MADVKYGAKGILGAILGILLTVFGFYIITAFSNLMPIDTMKVFFWIGAITVWVLNIIVTPMLIGS